MIELTDECQLLSFYYLFVNVAIRVSISLFVSFHTHLISARFEDVKEMVPEFYYLPEMFSNHNRLALGTRQDGTPVDDVVSRRECAFRLRKIYAASSSSSDCLSLCICVSTLDAAPVGSW